MNTDYYRNLSIDENELELKDKLQSWFVAEDTFMQYFEEIEEEGAYPDLYGKSVLLDGKHFPKVQKTVDDVSKILELSSPECFIYDSYKYLIDSEGINKPRLEISARLIKDFSENELKHIIAKEIYHIKAGHIRLEVLSEKMFDLLDSIPNLPVVNLLNQFGGSLAFEATSFHFRNIAFNWFKSACFSAENFAIAYTKDIKSSLISTLLTIFNERALTESINISSYINQISKIEACNGPAATIEIINEVIPYGPYRLLNMLRFIVSARGRKLYGKLS